ncbi:MAG TPA: acyltransferase [Opitutales bacterium]|nr:acyltransferase [Opitutales bacterium]
MKFRLIFAALLAPLPWFLKRPLMQALFGYRLHPTSRIGLSVVAASEVELGEGARIGNLNLVRGLSRLELGPHSIIAQLNWITGFPAGPSRHFAHQPGRKPRLKLGEHSAVTSRHLLDCTGGITIGPYTTIAGFRSQILTHSIDLAAARQDSAPVEIGAYGFIGTGCVILAGARLPDYCVLGAGAVLAGPVADPHTLYAGVPARAVKKLPADWKYFSRSSGFVE